MSNFYLSAIKSHFASRNRVCATLLGAVTEDKPKPTKKATAAQLKAEICLNCSKIGCDKGYCEKLKNYGRKTITGVKNGIN